MKKLFSLLKTKKGLAALVVSVLLIFMIGKYSRQAEVVAKSVHNKYLGLILLLVMMSVMILGIGEVASIVAKRKARKNASLDAPKDQK